jgi:hypothetical protein
MIITINVLRSSRKVPVFFLSGEGPHSRRYGRTAAMRLIVQPCDEDEMMIIFCPFPSNGAPVE